MCVVAISFCEVRTKRTIDETISEDRLLRCTSFTAEERPRDTAHGVSALLNIDGEREEIHTLPEASLCGCGHEDLCFPDAGNDCPIGELCELSGAQ
jgi:hypothetical protein